MKFFIIYVPSQQLQSTYIMEKQNIESDKLQARSGGTNTSMQKSKQTSKQTNKQTKM
jgi:hypothetical protein